MLVVKAFLSVFVPTDRFSARKMKLLPAIGTAIIYNVGCLGDRTQDAIKPETHLSTQM